MKYNLSKIMLRAWKNYREKKGLSFGECLHRAWLSAKEEELNTKKIEAAKATAGIQEETNTWSGWKQLGYEVIHGSRALFGVDLIWGSRGDGKGIITFLLPHVKRKRNHNMKKQIIAIIENYGLD